MEALQDGVATDPPSYLRGMSHDLRHLSALVDDLFLFATIEAGRLELASDRLDLAELADEAVEAVAPVAAGRHVKLRVEAPGPTAGRRGRRGAGSGVPQPAGQRGPPQPPIR